METHSRATVATPEAPEAIVQRRDDGGVTTLTLNRPRQYNALSEAMLAELQAALDDISGDDSVRVVVLAGNGPAFCAGHDLKEMRSKPQQSYYEELFARCTRMMLTLTQMPQPVIARVHGIATAAGCQLAATCDLAIASREARFAVSGVKVGLFCSTPSVALTRNIPRKRAFEMLFTGDFIDAETAAGYGLVNQVVDPQDLDAAVMALAAKIVAIPAPTIRLGKELFYRQIDQRPADAYRDAGTAMACNMAGPEAAEGVDAFLQKRPPRWNR